MISDDGQPILMDFGSTMKARVKVENRSQALLQQDIAAEQSTMAYRAPELFDVKTGVTLDEKVDIWSLGCTLFALAYSHSPFENTQTTEQGGSIAMAVMGAQYKHPASAYSQGLRDLIDCMLKVKPVDRPDIHEVRVVSDKASHSLLIELLYCRSSEEPTRYCKVCGDNQGPAWHPLRPIRKSLVRLVFIRYPSLCQHTCHSLSLVYLCRFSTDPST